MPASPKPVDGEIFLIDGNSLAYRAFFALPESIATADERGGKLRPVPIQSEVGSAS